MTHIISTQPVFVAMPAPAGSDPELIQMVEEMRLELENDLKSLLRVSQLKVTVDVFSNEDEARVGELADWAMEAGGEFVTHEGSRWVCLGRTHLFLRRLPATVNPPATSHQSQAPDKNFLIEHAIATATEGER